MTKNAHIIVVPFTGVGLHGGYRSDSWFQHRINIFKNYTLKSLANQSNKDFLVWFWMRPEEKTNPLVREIEDAMKEVGLEYVISYHGLLYHDDKFTNYNLKTKARNFMMMCWDMWVYKSLRNPITLLKQTWENKNDTLEKRLDSALKELQWLGYDFVTEGWVYLTRIDSDDMFHKEAVNLIQFCEPKVRKALVFTKGYMYNVVTGQLGEWIPPTNPPFHTIIFPSKVFFNAKDHKEYYGTFKSHEDIAKVFDCEVLDINKYLVTYHGKHISTAWDSDILRKGKHLLQHGKTEPYRGAEITAQGYCYTTSGQNISTHWASRTRKVKNHMIGKEFENIDVKREILKDFGI